MAAKSCGGGDKPCAHADHGLHWSMTDIDEIAAMTILRNVAEGDEPLDRFNTAHLVALGALSFEDNVLAMTDKGQCLRDWLDKDS
jgi:hypothetical protein